MKFKKIISLIIILCFIYLNTESIQAQDNNISDVIITTDISEVQAKKQIYGRVYIQFNNEELYNENVKLSYHIYDKENRLLAFENERYSFQLEDGKAEVDIVINLNEKEVLANKKYVNIHFDLVDEQNIYWFNDNPNLNIKTADICYENTFLRRIFQIYSNVVSHQIPQLLISIIFILTTVVLYKIYKKNNNLTTKEV